MKIKLSALFLVVLLAVGFFYRIYGLSENYSFWIDEFSSGDFAAAIVKFGAPQTKTGNWEPKTLLYQYLMALGMKIAGVNEFGARLPAVFFGTITILAVFLIFKKLFDWRVGLGVSLMTTFFAMEIVWSRQARSYALWQLVSLCLIYFFWETTENFSLKNFVFFLFFFCLSLISHFLTIGLIFPMFFYFLIFKRKGFSPKKLMKIKFRDLSLLFVFSAVLTSILVTFGLQETVSQIWEERTNLFLLFNHLLYYHSFFWRQYGLLVFGAILGASLAFKRRERRDCYLILVILGYVLFATFLVKWHDVRYLYPVFPIFFFVYFIYLLLEITATISNKKNFQTIIFFVLVLFVIANGYKFVVKPKKFYSPNTDMREIPLADYNLAYQRIKQVIHHENHVAVVDTWSPRMAWYLGRDYCCAYRIRSVQDFPFKQEKARKIETGFGFGAITDVDDLLSTIKDYKKGFVFIDGHEIPYLPKDTLGYIENNLKLEIKFDRFSLDPDPYDTWPAWLYSWGI